MCAPIGAEVGPSACTHEGCTRDRWLAQYGRTRSTIHDSHLARLVDVQVRSGEPSIKITDWHRDVDDVRAPVQYPRAHPHR